jgi:OmpA-OmpF porin, OOP family
MMRKGSWITLVLALCLVGTLAWAAGDDAQGSKDHPLFTRLPNFYIDDFDYKDFEAYPGFKNPGGGDVTVEGRKFQNKYVFKGGAKAPSETQILRNFANAATKIGGKVMYEAGGNLYLEIQKDNMVLWVQVRAFDQGEAYTLTIIEKAGMRQEVTADAKSLARDLNATGRVALYGIYFDTNKTEVKPESDSTLKEIARLLKENPKLRLHVVGHTDNVGEVAYNMKLSQGRAEAVVRALSGGYGVDAGRLRAHGVGPLAPVSSNKAEDGRAKNRRVELVEQ